KKFGRVFASPGKCLDISDDRFDALSRQLQDSPHPAPLPQGIRACIHKIAKGESGLIKSALVDFEDSSQAFLNVRPKNKIVTVIRRVPVSFTDLLLMDTWIEFGYGTQLRFLEKKAVIVLGGHKV